MRTRNTRPENGPKPSQSLPLRTRSQSLRALSLVTLTLACATLFAGSHNAFSQTQVVPLTPAGPNRPAEVPENYVITPNGYFHPSCVVQVDEGSTVMAGGSIQHADGSIQKVPACAYPHYSAHGEAVVVGGGTPNADKIVTEAATPTPTINHSYVGDLAYAEPNLVFGALSATWVVPPAPTSYDGQLIYLFPALEGNLAGSIIQPVLQWTLPGWQIASWNVDVVHGVQYVSNFVNVNVGDVLLGTIHSTCGAGNSECTTWNITTTDQTTGQSTALNGTPYDGEYYNYAIGGALEVYNVSQCSDYPPNGEIAFSNIALYDDNFSLVTPGWGYSGPPPGLTPQCNYSGGVVNTTEVALSWGGDFSVMTEGVYCSLPAICWRGFGAGSFGSLSNASLSGGDKIVALSDHQVASRYQGEFSVSAASNPGAAWLISATAGSVTLNGSAATYSYSSGTASWVWPLGSYFGFLGYGSVPVSVKHH